MPDNNEKKFPYEANYEPHHLLLTNILTLILKILFTINNIKIMT